MIHGLKETKARQSQRVIALYCLQNQWVNQRALRSLFSRHDVSAVLHFAVSCTWLYKVQQHVGQAADHRGQRRKAVIRDISGVGNRAVTNMHECTNRVHWTEAWHRFSSRDAIIVLGSVLEKHFLRWFYPRSRKRNHFQTLATGVPKLKTLLGTQRVKTHNLAAHENLGVTLWLRKAGRQEVKGWRYISFEREERKRRRRCERKRKKMVRVGIQPTAAAPSQPARQDVSCSDHSGGSKESASWRALKQRFGLTQSMGYGRGRN